MACFLPVPFTSGIIKKNLLTPPAGGSHNVPWVTEGWACWHASSVL